MDNLGRDMMIVFGFWLGVALLIGACVGAILVRLFWR